MLSFKLTVPPAVEPVLLADAKSHARIDTSADDSLVAALITGARQWAEAYTGRAFIAQTWQLWLDLASLAGGLWWDGVREGPVTLDAQVNSIPLPRPPLVSVNSVQTFDDTDTGAVWNAGNYFVDTIREPGRVTLRGGATWPVPGRLANGMMIEYVAGYGNDGTAVPEAIKTAIRQLVAHWYENRGESTISASDRRLVQTEVPLVIQALLDPFRVRTHGA